MDFSESVSTEIYVVGSHLEQLNETHPMSNTSKIFKEREREREKKKTDIFCLESPFSGLQIRVLNKKFIFA